MLPGIDDGAKTMEDSLSLIRQLRELGLNGLITTPHINSEYYPNTREIILGKLEEVRAALREHDIPWSSTPPPVLPRRPLSKPSSPPASPCYPLG
ncbi:MAG: hypothetical protein IPN20_04940 [Haliscomenobacter sp.]|nr:hypothetical protein [Haliscomenobacter sp.]